MKLPCLTIIFLIATATIALGDRPPEPPAYLRRVSSNVCAGIVIARNPTVNQSSDWRKTDYSVEIAVTSILKGTDIGLLDRIRVESDSKEWIGNPNDMPTGWNGVGTPLVNAQVLVYLKGSKSAGFRFVEPNGFVNLERLRANPTLLQSHVSDDEWETVEQNINNVAPVKSDSIMNAFTLTALLLLIAITALIACLNAKPKPTRTIAG